MIVCGWSGEGGAEIRASSTPTACPRPPLPSLYLSPSLISHLLPPTLAAILRRTKPITSVVTCAQPAAAAAAQPDRTGQDAPAKMVKRKSLDENEPDCGKGIPFPIQTFLWRQTRFGVVL